MFKFGDWVVYDPGYKRELGRVLRVSKNGEFAYVCYSEGCTAAATRISDLKPYDLRTCEFEVNLNIGYHRFDAQCPDYDPECCFDCKKIS